ncbi:MAG: hypothetical protein WA139_02150 [Candidatus Aenigmatarchaeota archaeon]
MAEKTENGKPTKDAIVKLIKDNNYEIVSSRILSNALSPSKKVGRTFLKNRGLTRYIGGILVELNDEGVLELFNDSAPSMKYRVKRDELLKFYNSISQSSPQQYS